MQNTDTECQENHSVSDHSVEQNSEIVYLLHDPGL